MPCIVAIAICVKPDLKNLASYLLFCSSTERVTSASYQSPINRLHLAYTIDHALGTI